MRTAGFLLTLAGVVAALHAQSAEPDRSYRLLRENEDWSFLKDPSLRQDVFDPIKYIPLGSGGMYVTVGGEIRWGVEHVGNDNWGKQPYMNSFFLQRYMLHSDGHLGKNVRMFVQLKSGLESGRSGGARPIDEKKADVEAAYIELGNAAGRNWLIFRAGRQELNYGSGRLISVREGPNVRQSFDGLKVRGKLSGWNVDAFAVRPDLDKPGFFNNSPDHQTAFWGVYATRPLKRRGALDLYYTGESRRNAVYNRGAGREVRDSVAARLSRPVSAESRDLDFDYECVFQFGSFARRNIRAWTIATDTGYSLPDLPLKPRFSIKADVSSGDNPLNGTLGTFYPVFPIGNYFGILADTGPGPLNFIDVHPRAVPANGSRARFVGYRPGIEARWQIDRHAYLQADYGIFYAGRFLKESAPGRNINYLELWAGYKF